MRIQWNLGAFEEIRRMPSVAAEIDSRAARIAAAAGPGYESSPYEGRSRHRASVITATFDAIRDQHRNNTLWRAIDAGR